MKLIVSFLLLYVYLVSCSSPYHIPNVKANWHQAFDHCKYNGMELVSIANHVAYNQLTAQVAQELNCSRICAVWIGANDLANEGTFAWAATGLRVSFANWKSNQPDNKHGDLEED
ncbi:C-type lectin 37Db-like [Aedes aegypti]|uniref:Uncharacterized protein n=1 Tax=Aedes aegypti TaxID=7159 RepID=A0A6I8U8S6_AEDAE|nr:C-type lectin 37Db-like [Aedes aegypti]